MFVSQELVLWFKFKICRAGVQISMVIGHMAEICESPGLHMDGNRVRDQHTAVIVFTFARNTC